MSTGANPIKHLAEPDLKRAIDEWWHWMEVERNCSAHTLDGYGRDLSSFCSYLGEHLGHPPNL